MTKLSFRIDEVADKLGVSRATVYRAIQSGELHAFKIRNARRIEAEEIERLKKKEKVTAD